MSFARFSSDKWMSDVYIYTNSGDNLISVHVAGNRFVFDDNGKSSREFIDDEFAGQSHHGLTISEAVEFMHTLSARGYHVPDKVIPALKENRHEVAWSPAELPGGVSVWTVGESETAEDIEGSIDILEGIIERKNAAERAPEEG